LIAAAIAPIANFYSKRTREHCSSETILGFRTLFALPVVALYVWMIEPEISYANIYEALPLVVLIGLLIFGVSKIMWMEALHRVTITKISAMMALVSMLTLLFAYLYLGGGSRGSSNFWDCSSFGWWVSFDEICCVNQEEF